MLNENNLDQRVPPTQDTPYEHTTPLIEKELNPKLNADYLLAAEEIKKAKEALHITHERNIIESNLKQVSIYLKFEKSNEALDLLNKILQLLMGSMNISPKQKTDVLFQLQENYVNLGQTDKAQEVFKLADQLAHENPGDFEYADKASIQNLKNLVDTHITPEQRSVAIEVAAKNNTEPELTVEEKKEILSKYQ